MQQTVRGRGPWRAWMAATVVLVTLCLAYGLTLAPGLTWANNGADGGDFAAAILTNGVPHPTGYPTYTLLGRLITWLPFGSPALALAALSAVTMGLAGFVLATTLVRAFDDASISSLAAAVLAGLAFGLAPIPWSQAVIAEVHGLHAFLLAVLIAWVAMLERSAASQVWQLVGLGLLGGIAVGNHLTFGLVLPVVLFFLWRLPEPRLARRLLLPGLGLLLGATVYLYIPLAAAGNPPINWGGASTWDGFTWLITAQPYQGLAFGLPSAEVPQRIAALANLMVGQFGVVGVVLAAIGLVYGGGDLCWPTRLTYWMVPAFSAFALGYNTADSTAYLIPAYLGVAWWLGLGAKRLLDTASAWKPVSAGLVMPALLVLVLIGVPGSADEVSARSDRRATQFWAEVEQQAPQGAFILSHGTEDSFTLWYEHFGLGKRPDLRVVVVPLTRFPWYRETVAGSYPRLTMPDAASDGGAWLSGLLQVNPNPLCETEVALNEDDLPVASVTCGP